MHLSDILPNADAVLALEPDELGVFILFSIKDWHRGGQNLDLETFTSANKNNPGSFPEDKIGEIREACHEA